LYGFYEVGKASKKDPYPLPFFDELLNIVVGSIFKWMLRIPSNFYSP
jgi:hypothetical protein